MKFLIAGLGNIGNEYAHTRHNIGFDVVMAFVLKHGGELSVGKLAYKTELKFKGKTMVCICPTTYMNLSGKAVRYWYEKEKIAMTDMLVIVDDLALPLNKLRLRPGGTAAGHNGLISIQEMLGTPEYPKLRFGIGNDFPKGRQSDFVLSRWTVSEEPLVKQKIDKCVEAIEIFATRGIEAAMNEVNKAEFTI